LLVALQTVAIAVTAGLVTLVFVIAGLILVFKRKQKRGIGRREADLEDIRTEAFGSTSTFDNAAFYLGNFPTAPQLSNMLSHTRCASAPSYLDICGNRNYSLISPGRDRRSMATRHRSMDADDPDVFSEGGVVNASNQVKGWRGLFPGGSSAI